ncbi:hypothetical protein GCK32_010709 [Trichostrongylus colubriformis]|uniref:Ionotropic glutamate receptor C-terminal domain-containing protein n=1 Tax=Trichostrongylus colubriformis TaxID=6319 RepID=A0AAN8IL61_TRICO
MFERDRVIALIGGSHSLLNAQLERLTDQLDIPLLTASDDVEASAGNTKIAFFPRAQLFEAIVDLFRYWRWNRITIVYEEDDRIRRIEPLLESDIYSNIRFQVIKVQNKDYMRAAKEVKEMEECRYQARKDCADFNRVLLDLNPEHSYNFLLAALQMGLIDLKHWFLLTNMELSTMNMDLFSYNHARYVTPYPVDGTFLIENQHVFNFTQFQQHVRQKWNTKTANSKNLKMMEAVFTFDAIYTFANTFTDVSAIMMVSQTSLTALEHFKLLLLLIGFWEPATEVHVNMSGDSRAQLQRNVQVSDELKPHFRVTTIMRQLQRKMETFLIGGFHFENVEFSWFTYAIHAVSDGKYGNDVYGNGSWDGMIGEILKGEAEMAVAPLTVNFRRSEVVSFTKPFLSLGISILYKVPDDYQPDLFSFLNPLSWQIWLAILAAIGRRNFAYLMESTSLEFEVSQNCNLTQIGGVLGSKGYGIALQKKSEWTDRISRQILLYQKRGIIEMKKAKWWRSKGATCTGTGSAVKQQRFSLGLHNVAGLFIILGAGLLFGVVTVVVELFIRCNQIANKENIPIWTELVNELRFALNLNTIENHWSRKKSDKFNGAVPPSDLPQQTNRAHTATPSKPMMRI